MHTCFFLSMKTQAKRIYYIERSEQNVMPPGVLMLTDTDWSAATITSVQHIHHLLTSVHRSVSAFAAVAN